VPGHSEADESGTTTLSQEERGLWNCSRLGGGGGGEGMLGRWAGTSVALGLASGVQVSGLVLCHED
jgi:hypothetical protein